MSIKSSELENRERGMALSDRKRKKIERETLDEFEHRVIQMEQRIEAAAALERPPDTQPHCGDCYRRGWHAAVKAIRDGVFP